MTIELDRFVWRPTNILLRIPEGLPYLSVDHCSQDASVGTQHNDVCFCAGGELPVRREVGGTSGIQGGGPDGVLQAPAGELSQVAHGFIHG